MDRDEGLPRHARALAVLLSFGLAVALLVEDVPFAISGPLTILVVACVVVVLRLRRPPRPQGAFWTERLTYVSAWGIVVAGLALSGVLLLGGRSWGYPVIPVILFALAAFSVMSAVSGARWAFWLHLAVQIAVYASILPIMSAPTDVPIYLHDSAAALLRGANPYELTFPNPFTLNESQRFFAEGFYRGDRILIGFPYLPGTLLAVVPGYLLGDVRLALVAALVIASVITRDLATDKVGRVLSLAVLVSPLSMVVVVAAWVEPVLGLGLSVLVWGFVRARTWAVVLGSMLLLTAKQYVVVALPLWWMVWRRFGMRTLVVSVGGACLLVLPFLLAGPRAFIHSVVVVQLEQPFRPDSISLAVDLANAFDTQPHAILNVLSLALGLGVAVLVARRAPSTGAWWAWGFSLSLLTTVLLSKQAFTNYYLLVQLGFILAAIPADHLRAAAADDGERGAIEGVGSDPSAVAEAVP